MDQGHARVHTHPTHTDMKISNINRQCVIEIPVASDDMLCVCVQYKQTVCDCEITEIPVTSDDTLCVCVYNINRQCVIVKSLRYL